MSIKKLNPNDLVVTSFQTIDTQIREGGTSDPTAQTFCRICPEETQTCYFCPQTEV